MSTDAEPQPVPQPHPVLGYGAITAFDRKLTGIAERAESEDAAQNMFIMLLIREVHTVKWILWWVLIIVPILVVVFGWLFLAATRQVPTATSTFGY
ncbi:MAG TPA: hypothetical protein VH333_24535 [Pseudonocardiaceae bacterium]|jgi:hypothetical protein|nr:hypothetical protein [Pseudonocardiaceae bacterium]